MTTIAYRDGVLAADTMMCSGGVLSGRSTKIVRRRDGTMCGAAGGATYGEAFKRWVLNGERRKPPKATQGDGWFDRGAIFRPDGKIVVFEPDGAFEVEAAYYALGSGKEAALGAMFAGADAVTAVRAAIEHDPHTGGDVTVLKRKSDLAPAKKRA